MSARRKPKRYSFIVEGRFIVKATNYREALGAVEASITGAGASFDADVETCFVPTKVGQMGRRWRNVSDGDIQWINDEFEAAWRADNDYDPRDDDSPGG